jgi:hypothetical protein
VTGELSRPIVAPAPTVAPVSTVAASSDPPRPIQAAAGTRLSLGGREPAVVDPVSGSIRRISLTADQAVSLFRQGSFTVLVADGHASVVPAGQAGPRRPLGRALLVIPALAADRAWLVDTRFGPPEQHYDLVEVGLADGRRHTHWTLPYRVAPVAVVRSGVIANDLDGDLVVVAPGSGRVRTLLARDATFVDARGDRVAWLADGLLHVRDLRKKTTTLVSPPPASAGWPCTPSSPAHGRPDWRSSTWTGAEPSCCQGPRTQPRPAASPASAGPRTAGCSSSHRARPPRSGPGDRASGPRAWCGWTATRRSTPSPAPWLRTRTTAPAGLAPSARLGERAVSRGSQTGRRGPRQPPRASPPRRGRHPTGRGC